MIGLTTQLTSQEMTEKESRIFELMQILEANLLAIPDISLNDHKGNRVYNTSNIYFSWVSSEQLIMTLGNITL